LDTPQTKGLDVEIRYSRNEDLSASSNALDLFRNTVAVVDR